MKKSSTALWRSKNIRGMFLAQLLETGESWIIRGMFLAQLLETGESWDVRGTFLPLR